MTFVMPDLPAGAASLADYREAARRRLPRFAFEYLDGGIGRDVGMARNYSDLDQVHITPRINDDPAEVSAKCDLLGQRWSQPFMVAPVGMSSMFHPGAASTLAKKAKALNIPFCLSLVAGETTEAVASKAGTPLWQQLYWPSDADVQKDILARMKALRIDTLVLTVDIPGHQWRERSVRAKTTSAPSLAAKLKAAASAPRWAVAMARGGMPTMPNLSPYVTGGNAAVEQWMFENTLRPVGVKEVKSLRDRWDGKLIVKGVMAPEDARAFADIGVDGIVVSNHGGRQLDAAPSGVALLPPIVAEVKGEVAILADGGIADGLDVLRMLRLGADFVMVGRLPYYAMAGYGDRGAAALDLLALQVRTVMMQIGVRRVEDLMGLSATFKGTPV
jgi:isopentenyl diphosphate isomerase/L-lactate dehydrogenase-like FMN-dependent dehydrogenase